MTSTSVGTDHRLRQEVAAGTSIAASLLLLTVGALSLLEGVSAVGRDEIFVPGPDYVYGWDLTEWGWVHIVLGVLLVIASLGLVSGAGWARFVAIVIAAASIVGNFLWLPWYPWWAVAMIALNVVVIWGVTTWQPGRR
ncbi:DUF7144 family membrane protein [Nocardia asteroides]|uniref:DUF7144 family membrane protein n=1 Tax=Nocardia asteroides TaxID=1824 RepID=UPI001E3F3376|nr:hypothetical protein [Nocardia asteroides]UGT61914.1 hypothetical protein LTT61_00730 [Nocardia asteroides]